MARARTGSRSSWGVFPHAERRQVTGRGYVVRKMESGYPVDQHNYGGVVAVAVFSRESAAESMADKLTREGYNKTRANPRRRRRVTTRRRIGRRNPMRYVTKGARTDYHKLRQQDLFTGDVDRVQVRPSIGTAAWLSRAPGSIRQEIEKLSGRLTDQQFLTLLARREGSRPPKDWQAIKGLRDNPLFGQWKIFDRPGQVGYIRVWWLPFGEPVSYVVKVIADKHGRSKYSVSRSSSPYRPGERSIYASHIGEARTRDGAFRMAAKNAKQNGLLAKSPHELRNPRRRVRRNPREYALSESSMWRRVREIAKAMHYATGARDRKAIAVELDAMADAALNQLRRGVHENPTLAVVGALNPPLGQVVEVKYRRTGGQHPGWYRHKFTSRATLFAMKDGTLRIVGR